MVFSPYNRNWRELNLESGTASSSDPPLAHVWTNLQSWKGVPRADEFDGGELSGDWKSPDHLRMRLTDEVPEGWRDLDEVPEGWRDLESKR